MCINIYFMLHTTCANIKKKKKNTNPLYRMFKTDLVLSFATFPGRSFFQHGGHRWCPRLFSSDFSKF